MTLRRLVSGDTPTLLALFVLGWLVSALYRIDWWRGVLGVTAGGSPALVVVFVALLAAGAWTSMLHRRFLWADPGELTWRDFSRGRNRTLVISGRVWLHWLGRLAALTYVAVFLSAVADVPMWTWQTVLLVVELGGVVTLPAAAGFGVPWRLPVAAAARRTRLVEGWRERVVRSVAVTFVDPGMLFPAARPVAVRTRSVRSLVLAGVLGRVRFAPAAVLLAVVAGVTGSLLPAVPVPVSVAVLAYAALVPFGGGAGRLWRSPGLRRWLDERDAVLRGWSLAAVAALATVWGAVCLAVTAVVDGAASADVWPVLLAVAAAVVRTAARPPVDHSAPGVTDTPFGQAPVHLIGQVLRGPDLVIVGLVAALILPAAAASVAAAVLAAWAVLR